MDVVLLDPMFRQPTNVLCPIEVYSTYASCLHLLSLGKRICWRCWPSQRQRCTGRVVLKRRLKYSVLARPDFQIKAKSVRFDVYVGLA